MFFVAVTNLFLSLQGLRLIHFPVAGFKSFLSNYRFILVVFLLQVLTLFFLMIMVVLLRLWI